MPTSYASNIQQDNIFRFWISLFTFLVCTLLSFQTATSNLLWITLLFISYNVVFASAHIYVRKRLGPPALQYSLLATDSLMITGVIYLSGGLQSPLYILYLVPFGLSIYHKSLSNFVYSAVLSFSLYGGLLYQLSPHTRGYIYASIGQLVILGVLTGVLYGVLILMSKERKKTRKLVSRANTLAHVADVLSGSLENSKDWIKTVTGMIEEEIREDGLRCRIALHKSNQPLLPPSGGKTAVQIPIMVGEYIFGTMLITRNTRKPLGPAEQDFFSSISKSLGLSLHRARLWNDFQDHLQKVEAKMIFGEPGSDSKADSLTNSENQAQTVDDMVHLMKIEGGKFQLKEEVFSIENLVAELIYTGPDKIGFRGKVRLSTPIKTLPPIRGDADKLRKVAENMIKMAGEANPHEDHFVFNLNHGSDQVYFSVEVDTQVDLQSGNDTAGKINQDLNKKELFDNDLEIRNIFCEQIADAHQGRFWKERIGPDDHICFRMTLPLARTHAPKKTAVE